MMRAIFLALALGATAAGAQLPNSGATIPDVQPATGSQPGTVTRDTSRLAGRPAEAEAGASAGAGAAKCVSGQDRFDPIHGNQRDVCLRGSEAPKPKRRPR